MTQDQVSYDKVSKTLTIKIKCDKGIKTFNSKKGVALTLIAEAGSQYAPLYLPEAPTLGLKYSLINNPSRLNTPVAGKERTIEVKL